MARRTVTLEVVKKTRGVRGFHVLPRRWVVERTFAWLGRSRRLSKDYERNPKFKCMWRRHACLFELTGEHHVCRHLHRTYPIQTDEPVLFDERGFLASPELWTRDLALGIAKELGIPELSEDHWRIVDRLRDHFLATGQLPVQPTLCRELELDSGCIQDLFDGPLHAWRVAGLPYPGEEALTYMNNMDIDETGSGS
jgi:dissimilatory sulfite reductase related protein